MIKINNKIYPFWGQFIEKKEEWIGGILEEIQDSFPNMIPDGGVQTKIIDITLTPNGKEHAFFTVCGEDFNCGFCTSVGGIGPGDEGWLTFYGYGGHKWRIKK